MQAPRHLYVHVPFCARRCSYCDFAIAVRRDVPVNEYIDSLGTELDLRVPESGWEMDTLYLGGGTPSRLGGEGIRELLERLQTRISLAGGAEVTMEANPDDVTAAAAQAWKSAGVNRVSLGIQSFDDGVLSWMHRTHDAETAIRAVETLRDAGLEELSVDLIFALPEALERDWQRDLNMALALNPTHLSLYGLTVEPGTPLGRWVARGEAVEAPEERYANDFLEAHAAATASGLEHYEVSNFARPGSRSRHNSAYWAHVPYAALGPGAHAFDGASRSWNVAAYTEWTRRLQSGEDPEAGSEILDDGNLAAERIYLGLRRSEGLLATPAEREAAGPWLREGWAVLTDGRVRLTPEGWLRLDGLAASLTAAPSPS